MDNQRVYKMPFATVYPLYIKKVERKGRSQAEVDQIITWLTGYTKPQIEEVLSLGTNFESFFNNAPKLNALRLNIKGKICGVQIEEIKDPIMREVRYLDKLVDELAKGKALNVILKFS